MRRLLKWFAEKWKKIERYLSKSRTFFSIIFLIIGVSYTIASYEFYFKEHSLWKDYKEAIREFDEYLKNKDKYKMEVGVLSVKADNSLADTADNLSGSDLATIDNVEDLVSSTVVGTFTSYNAEVGQTDADPFTMANGKRVYEGAVANNCLPFGTKIKVNNEVLTVADRMNSRYDCDHFDIFKFNRKDNIGKKELAYVVLK